MNPCIDPPPAGLDSHPAANLLSLLEVEAPAAEIGLPGFEAIENADQVRQREQFARLCTGLAALPLHGQFFARHHGMLAADHIEPARAAHQWLTTFRAKLEPEPPPPAVKWSLDGFLHRLVQANTLMERHGVEIAELLANRISPGPDIAIVRAALALLGEPDRAFGVLECGAGRAE